MPQSEFSLWWISQARLILCLKPYSFLLRTWSHLIHTIFYYCIYGLRQGCLKSKMFQSKGISFTNKAVIISWICVIYGGKSPKLWNVLFIFIGSGLTDFEPQLQGLSSSGDFTVIAWDPPGYGKSRPPERKFNVNIFHEDAYVAAALMQVNSFFCEVWVSL